MASSDSASPSPVEPPSNHAAAVAADAPPDDLPAAGRPRTAERWPLLLMLAAAVLGVYGQMWNHHFVVWDDPLHVTHNEVVREVSPAAIVRAWSEPQYGLYMPLTYTWWWGLARIAEPPASAASAAGAAGPAGAADAADAADGESAGEEEAPTGGAVSYPKLNPRPFLIGNLLLHLASTLLVFSILRQLSGHEGASALGALLFALHPLQVESVAWISEAKGLLAGCLSLLAIRSYLAFTAAEGRRRGAYYAAATAAVMLGMLAKPSAAAVPLVVAVLDVGLLRRCPRVAAVSLAPWFLLSGAMMLITRHAQAIDPPDFIPAWPGRLLVAADTVTFYLWKLIVPLGLAADHGRTPQWVLAQPWAYVIWLVPVSLLAAIAWLTDRRAWWTSAAMFVAALAPVLGLVPFVYQDISTVADRYVYLAMLGPALALAWGLSRHWRSPAIEAASVVVCLLALLTFRQVATWRDSGQLLVRALQVNPASSVSQNNQGILLLHAGRKDEAIERFQLAIEANPGNTTAHLNLASLLLEREELDKAGAHLRIALEQTPEDGAAHYGLGLVIARQGQPEEAIEHLRRAVELDPRLPDARGDLGMMLASRGQLDDATEALRGEVALQPADLTRRTQLCLLLVRQHRFEEAQQVLAELNRRAGDDGRTFYCRGVMAAEQGNPDEAIEQFRQALARGAGADWPQIARDLAWLLATSNDPARRDPVEALRAAQRAVTVTGRKEITSLDALAAAQAASGDFESAVATAQQARLLASPWRQRELVAGIEARLQQYRAGRAIFTDQPYRDDWLAR